MAKAQKGDSKPGYRQIQRGWTTKILALTDALGKLVRFELLPGNRYDTIGVEPLIHGIDFGGLLADKAFDCNWIIDELNERGATICISQRPQRLEPVEIDLEVYKWRHRIENFFCKLKEFKRIAMRSDKTDESFSAMIYVVALPLSMDDDTQQALESQKARFAAFDIEAIETTYTVLGIRKAAARSAKRSLADL